MQAIKLSKKYPEFKQDEIFDLINKFKWVHGLAHRLQTCNPAEVEFRRS